MARTDGAWEKVGGYIKPIFRGGVSLLVAGVNKYINFNSTSGESGYGIRDNSGTIEIKNSGGSWNAPAAGGEANTSSNLGTGEGIFGAKVGVDIRLKSLKEGTGITMSSDSNEITINATSGGGDMVSTNNLSDLDNAETARTNLGVDAAGTDNSTDVTLGGTGTYITIAGQVITVDPITESDISDLGAYITGITGEPLSDISDVTITSITSGEILKWNGSAWINQTLAEAGIAPALGGDDNYVTDAEKTKIGHISITQAVDLDAIESRVNALDASVVLMGAWDASAGTFPGGGTAQAGESYIVSVGGTVDGEVFTANDRIVAILDNASTATYASNWLKLDYTDAVLSVAGKTGAVSLTTADVAASTDKNYVTDAEKTVLGNTSGTNTGDQDLSALAPKASPTFTGTVTVPTGLTGVLRADTGVMSVDTDVTDIVSAASTTAAGKVELATIVETNTGTDTGRVVTPDGLAGSNLGIRFMAFTLNASTALTTSDVMYQRVPAAFNGMNLVSVSASVGTGAAGASSSGTPTFTVKNVTDAAQMLSTNLTVDANEYTSATAATPAVINTATDDVVTDDLIEVACTTAGTGTTYATITLGFQLP